jgi:TolB protein
LAIARSLTLTVAVTVVLAANMLASGNPAIKAIAAPTRASQSFLPGKLAYVQNGSLFVLDGTTHTLHRLTHARRVLSPRWSHDGQWLAYVLTDGSSSQIWVSRADGSAKSAVTPLGIYTNDFAWSPSSDILAVARAFVPSGGIHLIPAHGLMRTVARGLAIESIAWSPDGTQLAFTAHVYSPHVGIQPESLYVVRIPNLRVTRRYTLPRKDGSFMRLAAWWPDGRGVLYWVDPLGSSSLAADGMMLYSLHWAGKPKPLVTTLGYTDWVTVSGGRAMVVQGDYRATYDNKWLALCTETSGSCRSLVHPKGAIAVDPAWQPGGNEIAFVQARSLLSMGGFTPKHGLQQWLDSNTLWVESTAVAGARQIHSAGGDVHAPIWSHDGHGLLYVGHNAIWYDAHVGAGNPLRIAQLLQRQAALNYPGPNWSLFFFGHMDWHMLFAWYQGLK